MMTVNDCQFYRNSDEILIDIIIPTHNSQSTIIRCMNSILNIHNIHYDVILVDDGSIDDTPKINDWYSRRYYNICSIHQKNKGVSEARNRGIRHSHSKWLCFVDSDDFINAKKFVKVVKSCINQYSDLIVSNINFNGKDIGLQRHSFISSNIYQFLKRNYPLYGNELIHVVWNKIYKTSLIKKNNIVFPKDIEMGEDLIFVLRYLLCLKSDERIIQTNISYYNYYIYNNSTTKSFENNSLKSRCLILIEIRNIYLKYGLPLNAINHLKIKALYSILLNGLKRNSNRLKYLTEQRYYIHLNKGVFLLNKNINISMESKILLLIYKQPVIILLIFLYFINFIREITRKFLSFNI